MKFASQEERLNWLKSAAQSIKYMEQERTAYIMAGQFGKAFSLLKAIKFARKEFAKESKKYAKK